MTGRRLHRNLNSLIRLLRPGVATVSAAVLLAMPGCAGLHRPGDPAATWCDRLAAGLRIADTVAVPALTAAGVLAPGVAGPAATAWATVSRLAPLVTGWCDKPADPATVAQDAADLAQALAVVLAEYQARREPGSRAVDVERTRADMEKLAGEARARAVR